MAESVQLTLVVGSAGGDPEELDRSTRKLRAELQELPLDSVSLAASGDLPAGAKAADPATLGALAVSLAPVVFPALIELLKNWMGRKEGRTVVIRKKKGDVSTEIEIELKGPLSDSAIAALVKRLSA